MICKTNKYLLITLLLWGGCAAVTAQQTGPQEANRDFRMGSGDTALPLRAEDERRIPSDAAALEVLAAPETLTTPSDSLRPFYMSFKTNMLYDLLAVPNVGVEFHLGKNWSVAAGWMYSWWSNDRKHHYWRIYGGDMAIRKWFGKKAQAKPLTGHHIGIYGQAFTYDFEWGGKGYMGGQPSGTLWDRTNYAVGVEYGYSLPIARRLNIDFTLGIGYWGGKYYEYIPQDGHYVWQTTKNRHWYGPTKAEISLVWLLGNGNSNKKGGAK